MEDSRRPGIRVIRPVMATVLPNNPDPGFAPQLNGAQYMKAKVSMGGRARVRVSPEAKICEKMFSNLSDIEKKNEKIINCISLRMGLEGEGLGNIGDYEDLSIFDGITEDEKFNIDSMKNELESR